MSQCFHRQQDCSVCKKWPELNGSSKTCCSLTRIAVDANGEWLVNVHGVRSVLYFLRIVRPSGFKDKQKQSKTFLICLQLEYKFNV